MDVREYAGKGESHATGAAVDRIAWIRLSRVFRPLPPISDAKVLTGRQKPLTGVTLLVAEIETTEGHAGLGFSYCLRAGGLGQYAHACELAPELLGEDPNDIGRLWDKLVWTGASVGRSGMATQAIAAFDVALWDLKARRAGLSLAKLLGAHRESVPCYNTSGGYLSTPTGEMLDNIDASLAGEIGGIKMKVGQPDWRRDLERVEAVRRHLGDAFPLMVDANQQWDRPAAQRIGRLLEPFGLTWIEEPIDAYDVDGYASLAAELDTPVSTGEMLTSVAEHWELIERNAVDVIQPDIPRVGGVTPFLKIASHADHHGLRMAPHFVMEIHIHMAAAYGGDAWVEHFEWLEPVFNERLEIRSGRMIVPERPGLGLSLSDQAATWTQESAEVGTRP
jgi:L-talarate/galactarate dehydratase